MSRAQLVAIAALGTLGSTLVGSAGCKPSNETTQIVQPYGAPPRPEPDAGPPADAGTPAPEAGAAIPDPGGPVALYGAPPPPKQ
jgi:hypothetical protein